MTQFIFVTGGVISSIGKGILAASVAAVLEDRQLRTTLIKLDPYLNVDAGTMSPFQHGEVFVTADGCETDLDLGHYERFISARMSQANTITSGQVYQAVIQKERDGKYDGGTVQVIPHVVDEIKTRLMQAATGFDIAVVEIGGTVGDIESLPFMEAIRQMRLDLPNNTLYIHLTFVPFIANAGEIKTKPTQHSVKEMRSIGLQPDVLVCRSEKPIHEEACKKISLFTSVPVRAVIGLEDVSSIYSVPALIQKKELDAVILEQLGRTQPVATLVRWNKVLTSMSKAKQTVKIGLVCKYCSLKDAYLSLFEALTHAAIHTNVQAQIDIISSEQAAHNLHTKLTEYDALVVPGGFGKRGTQGKLQAIQHAREHGVPFLGICLGLQLALVEFARNVCGMENANSTEFDGKTPYPVIALVEQWQDLNGRKKVANTKQVGGTMRLGEQHIELQKGSIFHAAYNHTTIVERHRHRYECNSHYLAQIQAAGLVVSGVSQQGLVETIELPTKLHPWFAACQFHPEFTSNPLIAHPLFLSFLKTAKRMSSQSTTE